MSEQEERYSHWLLGDNLLRSDQPFYLINLEFGLSIRFSYGDSLSASYGHWRDSITDVQFLHGNRPSPEKVEELMEDAWNFLGISERLEDDMLDEEY